MQVKQKVVIKGSGFFLGNVEGKDYDNGQIFIEEEFSKAQPNYIGFRTVEYKCLDSAMVRRLQQSTTFPCTAEVTMELSATKRAQEIVCVKIDVIEPARAMPKAA
jgi:hypothetical protein